MKKFVKSGHLEGNTNVSLHGSPFIHGTIAANSSGSIDELAALATPWTKQLRVENDIGSVSFVLTDVNTSSTLADIVSIVNADTSTTKIEAFILAGSLVIKTQTTGADAFIRVLPSDDPATPSVASYLGFVEHPHSQATVFSGDIKSSSVDTLGQKNPTGTKFIAKGEDRSSESYNRALAALGANSDSHYSMLNKGVGVSIQLKLEVDHVNQTVFANYNPRFILDSTGKRVKAISLASNIGDSLDTVLQSRVLVGTLSKDSTIHDLRKHFQLTDHENKELLGGGGNFIRITGATTGGAAGNSPGYGTTLTLTSTPSSSTSPATAIGGGGNVLGIPIPIVTSTPITKIIDSYTIECSGADFSSVSKGDRVTISGSIATPVTNNGIYFVDNVVSTTVLELKPSSYSDIDHLNAEVSATGSVVIDTGGMWLKNPTLWLWEYIQLPLLHDLYLTIPIEEIIGDLPEDAMIGANASVDVPHWIMEELVLEKSLDGMYKGQSTTRKAGGYYIDTDARPVSVKVNTHRDSTLGAIEKSINTVEIKADNTIVISNPTTSDYFVEDDIGRLMVFNTGLSFSSAPSDTDLLDKEVAVIIKVLDTSTAVVKKISRDSADLPITSTVASIDVYSEIGTPSLPGGLVLTTYNDVERGGISYIIENSTNSIMDPNARLTSSELIRIHKTESGGVSLPVFRVGYSSSSDVVVQNSHVDGHYLNLSYRFTGYPVETDVLTIPPTTSELLLRIYNGPNVGFYSITGLTSGTQPKITLARLSGSAVSLVNTSIEEYASIYRVSSSTRAHLFTGAATSTLDVTHEAQAAHFSASKESTAGNAGTKPVHTMALSWKGEGSGIAVTSNLHRNNAADVYRGVGSSGANLRLYSGPGTMGIYNVTTGFQGFSKNNMASDAEVLITDYSGRGSAGMYTRAFTYNLDPKNIISLRSTPTYHYFGGAGQFASYGEDPALVAFRKGGNRLEVPSHLTAKAAAIVGNAHQDNFVDVFGAGQVALAIYGSVYSPAVTKTNLTYTESAGSFAHLFTSEPLGIEDVNSDRFTNYIGNKGIIARLGGGRWRSLALEPDYDRFNIPHLLVIQIEKTTTPPSAYKYPDFIENPVWDNPQYLVGSFVALISDGNPAFTAINDAIGDSLSTPMPFKFRNEELPLGCKGLLKVVSIVKENGIVYAAVIHNGYETIPGLSTHTPSPIDCVIFRSKFKASLDLYSWARIGANSTTSAHERYTYTDETYGNKHKDTILWSIPSRLSTGLGGLVFSSPPTLGTSTKNTRNLTVDSYPSTSGGLRVDADLIGQGWRTKEVFDASNWESKHQSPDFSSKIVDECVGGFSTTGSIGDITYGDLETSDILIRSEKTGAPGFDAYDKYYCVVGNAGLRSTNSQGYFAPTGLSSEDYKLRVFESGGKKLVLHSSTWLGNESQVTHTLFVKVGANHLTHSNGFYLDIIAANSHPEPKLVTVTLFKEGVGYSAAKEFYLNKKDPTDPAALRLHQRTYERHTVYFAKDELDGARTLLEGSSVGEESFLLQISTVTEPSYLQHNLPQNLSFTALHNIGRSLTYKVGANWSFEDHLFPDATFVHSVAVRHDHNQAFMSSGLDVGGQLRPRSVRLLNAVTGYQVVGPAQVDLLQNSEYGNAMGHEKMYPEQSAVSSVHASRFGDKNVHLEGRDVGLLPMWFAMGQRAEGITLKGTESGTDVVSEITRPNTNPLDWEVDSNNNVIVSGSMTGTIEFFTIKFVDRVVSSVGCFSDRAHIGDGYGATNAHAITFEDEFVKRGNVSTTFLSISFSSIMAFTRYYRPKFDKTSFFRKGVHSTAIHAHIPYFDPLFYWEYCSNSIFRGKFDDEISDTNIVEHNVKEPGSFKTIQLGYSKGSRWDMGSYRQVIGAKLSTGHQSSILSTKVNPDAYVPPGRTGFVVPLDPPHGSVLTAIDLNMGFRPSASRAVQPGNSVGDTIFEYNVWYDLPDKLYEGLSEFAGINVLNREKWREKEGYLVRLWRHTLFEEGTVLGENPDGNQKGFPDGTQIYTDKSIFMDGNATLLHEHVVEIRENPSSLRPGVGRLGDPENYYDTSTGRLMEAISKVKIKLPCKEDDVESPNFLVNRASYSYFVTIEFYTGVRKTQFKIDTNQLFDTTLHVCHTVPGMTYGNNDTLNTWNISSQMQDHNVDHFPYMWTPAFPGKRPDAMSHVFGRDAASLWEGYWTPYPSYSGLDGENYYPSTVYRHHPLNSSAYASSNVTAVDNDGTAYTAKDAFILPTTDLNLDKGADAIKAKCYPVHEQGNTSADTDFALINLDPGSWVTTIGPYSQSAVKHLLSKRPMMQNHTVWYPVIKFRGLRITYQMDRPGHGGWGG